MVVAAALSSAGCGGDEAAPPATPKCRALHWLGSTPFEIGVDSLVMLDVAGELSGDPLNQAVISKRTPDVSPTELATYGGLLELDKPPFEALSLEGAQPNPGTPDPKQTAPLTATGESLIEVCLSTSVQCQAPPECEAYVNATDAWGFVLTHQAVWLAFERWLGCTMPVDVDARRRGIAASLLKEATFDSTPGDLTTERLVMIGLLGAQASVDPAWVTSLREAAQAPGCFRAGPAGDCSTHTTALAVLALTLAGSTEKCE